MKKICYLLTILSLLLLFVACAAGEDALPLPTESERGSATEIGTVDPAVTVPTTVTVTAGAPDTEPPEEVTEVTMTVTDAPATTTTAPYLTTRAATTAAAMAEATWTPMADGESFPTSEEGGKMPSATATMPGEHIEPAVTTSVQVGAGMLTAGEWKDLDDIPFWTKLLQNNNWYALMESRGLFANKIVPVKVTDGNDTPCFNVPVILKDTEGKEIYKAVTDINGMAYLLYDLDNQKQEAKCVSVGGADYDIVKDGETKITVDPATANVKQLDLLFMIDTTGSMGDELSYLQAELRDVIRKISAADEAYSICLSVNFYRDTGDEYVVRSFEFTSDIDQAIEQLNQQSPNGGGDYAEAVHLALEDIANNHQWRKDSVKLCFMVLDAPPHTDREIKGIDDRMQTTVMSMAEKGIRLIPLASSGVNTETEFLLRSWAVMTGGTYTFLTNHSGIGNSHLEPTIGAYEVEKLNDLLVRVISEYCGI